MFSSFVVRRGSFGAGAVSIMATALAMFITAALTVLSTLPTANAQFLRDATHQAPIFFNERRMNFYFVDQEWRQDPDQLAPMERIDIPFEWAQGWLRDRRTFSRALVMGQPESCPLMAGIYGAPDPETAVRLAFTSCFFQLGQLEAHQREDCGCQLAMFNEIVFIEPGGFTNFAAAPAILEFDDGQADVLGIVHFGEELLGRNQDIRFVDATGAERCTGTYSINALLLNELEMTCDFLCEPYNGSIRIENFGFGERGFQPTASIQGQTCSGANATLRVGKMQGG